jgi:hypothetical protein
MNVPWGSAMGIPGMRSRTMTVVPLDRMEDAWRRLQKVHRTGRIRVADDIV